MLGRSSSACGPLRQILQRKRISAFGGRAAVTQTPHDVAVDPLPDISRLSTKPGCGVLTA